MRTNSFPRALRGDAGAPPLSDQEATHKSLRPRLSIVLGLIVLGILVLAACGGVQEPDGRPEAGLAANLDFPISLYRGDDILGATEINFSDLFQGKPVVLNFWAGLCPPCRAEIPDFQRFHEEYGDRIILFGVDAGPFTGLGSNQAGIDLIEELGVSYPVGSTTDANIMREYRVLSMPSTVFMTRDGEMFQNRTGILDEAKLVEIAEEMLALP